MLEYMARIAASILRAKGREDLALWVTDWPEAVGKELAEILFSGNGTDISQDSITKIEALKAKNPRASERKTNLVENFADDLELMRQRVGNRPVLVFRGFFHDEDVLIGWVQGTEERPIRASDNQVFIGGALGHAAPRIFFLPAPADSDAHMRLMNEKAEFDPEGTIAEIEGSFSSAVDKVTGTHVYARTREIPADRTTGSKRVGPIEQDWEIRKPEAIFRAFESLGLALTQAAERSRIYKEQREEQRDRLRKE